MNSRIAFLDFDGVLNNHTFFKKLGNIPQELTFDPNNIHQLQRLAKDFLFVISSAWRLDFTTGHLTEVLKAAGFTGTIIDQTPSGPFLRGDCIMEWMRAHRTKLEDIVILDDQNDMGVLLPRLVQTNPLYGLTAGDVNACFELLRIKQK